MLGVGAIIGTGIFVLTGRAAAAKRWAGRRASFVIAGIASRLRRPLCYAEMASMIPSPAARTPTPTRPWGSSWRGSSAGTLILEYLRGAATVSVGWSGYVVAFIKHTFGVDLPKEADQRTGGLERRRPSS